jgi:hypothetical protein
MSSTEPLKNVFSVIHRKREKKITLAKFPGISELIKMTIVESMTALESFGRLSFHI